MSDEGVVDLSDAPRHTGWGEENAADDAAGGVADTSGDLDASAQHAVRTFPGINAASNIKKIFDDSTDRVERLFDGEATHDDLLQQVKTIFEVQAAAVELGEIGLANAAGPDPFFWLGALAGSGVEFVYAYFQPLQDLQGLMWGNTERIKVSAMMWEQVSSSLISMGNDVGIEVISGMAGSWQGSAQVSAMLRLSETQSAVEVGAVLSNMLADLMNATSDLAKAINGRMVNLQKNLLADVFSLISMLLNPVKVWQAVAALAVKVAKLVLELQQMAVDAMRVFGAGALLMTELVTAFERTMDLLTRMANPPGPSYQA